MVYNGYGQGGEVFTYRKGNSTPTESTTISDSNDAVFSVTVDDILYGSGEVAVTLTEPGCIAVVELKSDGFLEQDKESGHRWAASTIILADDFY